MAAQFFHGASNAFLRRVLVATPHFANGTQVAMLETAQHDGRPVAVAQISEQGSIIRHYSPL
jgi:predicted alpha/beta-hydrolase family hydrolase